MNFENLEKNLNLKFTNRKLLEMAFTHRSYLNESKEEGIESNERLEFLGDSVLQFLTSEFLYGKYKSDPEGTLTSYRAATVNTNSLSREALRLELGNYLFMSKGEEATGGRTRPYIMANTFEALLGALYMEFGMEVCEKFLHKELFYKIDAIVKEEKYKDPKSTLQEVTQEKFGITPIYKVINETGPDHDKVFTAGAFLGDRILAEGRGPSKQRAEEQAAQKALEGLKNK
ncbi:ribonuclease III [candidate division WWE3 bacterium CG08_land_8_20_14_0_20_40_13]|uniref:Ribonuclease 3 n=1 Tax=candidate division WWE3 bacterium CG08_land_8_20_14_0_20_40_13 TaxID=1975084 RepID=A0A2H0XG07_UNCKA|nr:MAG: ribonuclease III [candidate division WWE3 bacterium CG08_land_8_20_14_0_20_40_13]